MLKNDLMDYAMAEQLLGESELKKLLATSAPTTPADDMMEEDMVNGKEEGKGRKRPLEPTEEPEESLDDLLKQAKKAKNDSLLHDHNET